MDTGTPMAGRDAIERARADGKKTLVIVMSKGGADMAYTSLTLATTARALGMEVHIYFTFWGMQLLSPEGRQKSMEVLPPEMRKAVVVKLLTVEEFLQQAEKAGVYLHACSPTMDWYGLTQQGVESAGVDILGPATYLERASRPDVLTLFI
jgi:peroxiredoxin family protein